MRRVNTKIIRWKGSRVLERRGREERREASSQERYEEIKEVLIAKLTKLRLPCPRIALYIHEKYPNNSPGPQ